MSKCTGCGKLHILKRTLCDACYITELEATEKGFSKTITHMSKRIKELKDMLEIAYERSDIRLSANFMYRYKRLMESE